MHNVSGSRQRPGVFALVAMLVVIALLPQPAFADTDLGTGETGVVAYADGDNVRLRSAPGGDSQVLGSYAEGTRLKVVGGLETGSELQWYRVEIDGTTGYMAADFIANSDGFLTGTSGSAVTSAAVRLRSGPSTADRAITTLAPGTSLQLTGENIRGWLSVSASAGNGYVYGAFLSAGSTDVGGTSSLTSGGTRYVLERVHLRTGPGTSYRSMAVLAVGTKLDFTGETDGSYAKVSSSSGTGWVAARYIGPRAPGGGSQATTKYTTDRVHLRSGPGTSYRSLGVLAVGAKLDLTGESENGFVKGATSRGTGWVSANYVGDGSSPAATKTAYTNDSVSLRRGPGSGNARIAMLSTGTKLSLTGAERNGYQEARTSQGNGWVAASYISDVAPQYTGGTRYTIDSVNLRRGPRGTAGVIRVVPSRTTITFTGTVVNNYGKVATSFGDGWISIDFFRKTQPSTPGSLVVWPVKGGTWYVSQGYNGSSHQNTSQHWQYYYSFDLKRSSGNTAWQPVYAPVDGTIRWIDESTGGMSIYMGDGRAFAMFHVLWDGGIREGQSITKGQYLGVIAPANRAGNGGSPHLHMTAWTTSDGGNWSRRAQPFTGRFAIEGASFPATGASNDYLRYEFNP